VSTPKQVTAGAVPVVTGEIVNSKERVTNG